MILTLLSYLLGLGNLIICIILTIIVLLQRGEEGMFARIAKYGQIKTNNNTLRVTTIWIGLIYCSIPIISNLVFYKAHISSIS